MRKDIVTALTALFLASALLSGCADKPPEYSENLSFSARLVMDYKDASQEYKFNFSGDKTRLDMVKPGTGVSIIRKDLGVIWTLMSDNKLFLELPVKPENKNPLVFRPDEIVEYEKLGEETVDGRTLLHEKIVIKNEGEEKREFYRWFDTGLGWPVRIEASDGSWKMRLTDIEPGPQDPALFEVPPDYRMITARKTAVPDAGPH